jgi:hypothetical protein
VNPAFQFFAGDVKNLIHPGILFAWSFRKARRALVSHSSAYNVGTKLYAKIFSPASELFEPKT